MSKRNPLMPKLLSCGSRAFLLLFLTEFIVFFCTAHATAGQLRDVRIGEYDGFTRIVFEVDTPSAHPRIEIKRAGQLSVAFDRTEANLVRKIPVERSRHIKTLQFWHQNGHLSAIFEVDYPHYRFETFSLDKPPRVAVDIFPVAPPPDPGQTGMTATQKPVQAQSEVSPENNVPQDKAQLGDTEPPPSKQRPIPTSVGERRSPSTDADLEAARMEEPKLHPPEPKKEAAAPPTQYNRQTSFRLQFFLVIGLVVITIGILCLLLMMLFARHRFSKVKSELSAGESLRQQDEKIDAINARIQEQFERYDKA